MYREIPPARLHLRSAGKTRNQNEKALTRISILVILAFSTNVAWAQSKVYISADMEGLTGAVTSEQLGPSGFEYQRFREFMTEEVLAAIRGARAAGATEFLVSDSHGNGQNLLIDRFPKDVQIVRSWPRPLGMMGGSTRASTRFSSRSFTSPPSFSAS